MNISPIPPPIFADIVLKLNDSGTKFNKRVLCVKDDVIFYYHAIPNKFLINNFDTLKGNPKAGIQIEDVFKIYDHVYRKINCFSIEFPKEKLIKYKSTKPSIMKPGNSNMGFMSSNDLSSNNLEKKNYGKIIRWVFSTKCCENQDKTLDFWLKLLCDAKKNVVNNKNVTEKSMENVENSATNINKVRKNGL